MTEERFDRVEDIFEKLGQQARVQAEGAWPMDKDVLSEADFEAARSRVNAAIEGNLISAAELARRTGIKPTAISQIRNNNWVGKIGTRDTAAKKLVNAIDQIRTQQKYDETRIDGFVTTSVATAINEVIHITTVRRLIGAFVIPAGSGKTITLEAARDARPGSILVTVTGVRSSRKALLELWARELALQTRGRACDLFDAICNKLRGTDRLTMLDECHKLQLVALDVITEIWNETKCPIVMAGTPSFFRALEGGRIGTLQHAILDQLQSRVGVYRDLSELVTRNDGSPERLVTREDIIKLFNRGHVRLSRDAADFLLKHANAPGKGVYRTCMQLVQMCADLWAGQEVTRAMLQAVLKMKLGESAAAHRSDWIESADWSPAVATA